MCTFQSHTCDSIGYCGPEAECAIVRVAIIILVRSLRWAGTFEPEKWHEEQQAPNCRDRY